MAKVILALYDESGKKLKKLLNSILIKSGKVAWQTKERKNVDEELFSFCGVEVTKKIIHVNKFEFKENSVTGKGKTIIDAINDYFIKKYSDGKSIDKIFISVTSITDDQLTLLTKKSSDEENPASGARFYNFGKSYLMNLTFTDTDYAEFENNIAHEAINVFKSDDPDGKRYFYLCDDGKISGYFTNFSAGDCKIPDSYYDPDKITLLNYSKLIKFNKQEYVILQKIDHFEVFEQAFKKYENRDYTNIKYYGVCLSEILKRNKYNPKNKNNIDPAKYPLISFELKQDCKVKVTKPGKEIIFKPDDEQSQSLKGQACKRILLEGTSAYKFIDEKVANKEIWTNEKNQTLKEYINDEFENDEEKDNVLSILKKDRKETYFTLLIGYCFEHAKEVFASLFNKAFQNISINNIEEVNCEKYNIDVSVYFSDQSGKKHLLVLENKIDADFTEKGEKDVSDFFKDEKIVGQIKKKCEKEIESNSLESNQLTKYYMIAQVIGKKEGIDENNIHFLILGPEYRRGYCEYKKADYCYGNKYTVLSYKDLYDAIFNFENSNSLKSCVKDIINQLKLSIWPYISDSATYYKRRMKYRFARVAKEIFEENEGREKRQ